MLTTFAMIDVSRRKKTETSAKFRHLVKVPRGKYRYYFGDTRIFSNTVCDQPRVACMGTLCARNQLYLLSRFDWTRPADRHLATGSTRTAVRHFQLPAPKSGTLSQISSGTRPSVRTVSDVCLKRTCSLDTRAFSALEVFDDNRAL